MKKRRFAVPVLRTVIGVLFVLGMTLLPEREVINKGGESEFARITDRFVGESMEEAKARFPGEAASASRAGRPLLRIPDDHLGQNRR